MELHQESNSREQSRHSDRNSDRGSRNQVPGGWKSIGDDGDYGDYLLRSNIQSHNFQKIAIADSPTLFESKCSLKEILEITEIGNYELSIFEQNMSLIQLLLAGRA